MANTMFHFEIDESAPLSPISNDEPNVTIERDIDLGLAPRSYDDMWMEEDEEEDGTRSFPQLRQEYPDRNSFNINRGIYIWYKNITDSWKKIYAKPDFSNGLDCYEMDALKIVDVCTVKHVDNPHKMSQEVLKQKLRSGGKAFFDVDDRGNILCSTDKKKWVIL